MRYFNCLVLVLLVILISACPGDKKPPSENIKNNGQPLDKAAQSETKAQPKRSIDLKPQNETEHKASQPPPRQISDTTSFFSLSPQARIVVEDFKIGPLQDFLIGQYDRLKAALVVNDFFKGLAKKEIKLDLIKNEMRTEIERSLAYPLSQGLLPESIRIGRILPESTDEISVNVRVFKGQSVTEGEIYLVKDNGEWVIIDLQIGLTLLAEKYNKETEPFSPTSYKWLLRDYFE
ncbi:MAG: hypothetical protein JW822_01735 [Spirochaetales bacterium]|nr:hypothetical protein [Spirochaetales bacterium]